jgi:predicted MFS family arabinose efflux permease
MGEILNNENHKKIIFIVFYGLAGVLTSLIPADIFISESNDIRVRLGASSYVILCAFVFFAFTKYKKLFLIVAVLFLGAFMLILPHPVFPG